MDFADYADFKARRRAHLLICEICAIPVPPLFTTTGACTLRPVQLRIGQLRVGRTDGRCPVKVDPLVEEPRQAGEAYVASFRGDGAALRADLRRRSEEAGRQPVSPRPTSTAIPRHLPKSVN